MLIGNCWGNQEWRFDDDEPRYSSTSKLLHQIPCVQQRYRGLGWDKKFGCWRVRVFYAGRQRHVGRFKDDLSAAPAYNKVVSFLYGDKAILNIVPQVDECVDTFDIPSAIRLAKLEAQHAAGSGSSISMSSSSITSSISSSNSMSLSVASGPSQHAMQDSYLPLRRHAAALLPGPHSLEPGWQAAPRSAALLQPGSGALLAPLAGSFLGAAPMPNSMVLPSGLDLAASGLNTLPSTSGLQNLALSTGFLQDGSAGLLQDVSTGFMQDISAEHLQDVSTGFLQGVSTGLLQSVSTGLLQDSMPPVSSCTLQAFNRQACMTSTGAAAARTQLFDLQQQSLALAAAPIPVLGSVGFPVSQPRSSLSMMQQTSLSTYGVPVLPGLVPSSVCHPGLVASTHDLGEPLMPYAHALSTGVVMGFPVGGAVKPMVLPQAFQGCLPMQHISFYPAAASVSPVPLSCNNGVSVEFAPPLPA